MLIEKIKAHLTQDSLTEFNSIIGDIISQAKMECLKDIENSNCLNLDYIALLRNHDDKYELSKLEYTGTTLSATKNTTTILP